MSYTGFQLPYTLSITLKFRGDLAKKVLRAYPGLDNNIGYVLLTLWGSFHFLFTPIRHGVRFSLFRV